MKYDLMDLIISQQIGVVYYACMGYQEVRSEVNKITTMLFLKVTCYKITANTKLCCSVSY